MRLFKFVSFSFIFFFALSASADPQNLDCDSVPGGYLCRQIKVIRNLIDTRCTGQACDALFANQARSAAAFVDYYNRNVFSDIRASSPLGTSAYYLADAICSYRWRGEVSIFSNTIDQMNLLVPALVEIQSAAGIKEYKTCRLIIN